VRIRGDEKSHQQILALRASDAELVREVRANEGYVTGDNIQSNPVENGIGFLYVEQTVPDLDKLRIKLGYA
jgi:hypothetical protein